MGETGKVGDVKNKRKKTESLNPELIAWQERLSKSDVEYGPELEKMDER